MRLSNKIVLASMNPDKYQEFKALLAAYPDVELLHPEGLVRNPENLALAEVHHTYLENAAAKARLINHACHYPALGDDTGLEVEALDGKPGVRSQRYAPVQPGQPSRSRIAQDQANLELLLSELRGRPQAARNARFVTTLALVIEGIMVHATGVLEGTIAEAPRGNNGFGYDPVFIPKGMQKTLAELTDGEKNAISHRAKALHELFHQIQARGIVFAKP